MSVCAKCSSQLPPGAGHCVFCGSRQITPATVPAGAPKSTMMGHPGMLDELQQELADKQRLEPTFEGPETLVAAPITPQSLLPVPPTTQPPQQPPAQQFSQPSIATPEQQPIAQRPLAQQQRAQQPIPPNQQQPAPQQQPIALPQQQPQQQPAPPQQPIALPQQQPQQPIAPNQQQPTPQQHPVFQQPGQTSQSSPLAANFGMQDARFGDEAHQAVPAAVVPYQDSLTEKVAALPAPEAMRYNEDWDESLITVLLVFGVLLIACFVAPWSIGSGKVPTEFAWSVFAAKNASVVDVIVRSLIAVTGLCAIGVGSLRLSNATRALLGLSIGLVPIVANIATAGTLPWRGIVSSLGTVFVVGALLLRTRYIEHILPRTLVSAAALMLLALYFIPIDGQVPLMTLLDAIAANPGATKILPIIGISGLGILPFTLILLSFLAWLPGAHRTIFTVIAMMLLFAPFVAGFCQPLLGDNVMANLKSGLSIYLFSPLAATAWIAMASYGVRGILDQKLS